MCNASIKYIFFFVSVRSTKMWLARFHIAMFSISVVWFGVDVILSLYGIMLNGGLHVDMDINEEEDEDYDMSDYDGERRGFVSEFGWPILFVYSLGTYS